MIARILGHPKIKKTPKSIATIVWHVIRHKDDHWILKRLECPDLRPPKRTFEKFSQYAKIFQYAQYAIDNKDSLIKRLLRHFPSDNQRSRYCYICNRKFSSSYCDYCYGTFNCCMKRILLHAIKSIKIEHKNNSAIEAILQHPKFKPNSLTDALFHAIKYKNEFAIKKILEHPLFEKINSWDQDDTSRFLSFIIETIKTENPKFEVETNILEKKHTFTISTSTLGKCKIKLIYDIEKKQPSQITLLSHTFSLRSYSYINYEKNRDKIDKLVITIIKHPYFKKAISPPNILEQKDLEERVEFVKNKILEIKAPKKKGKIMLQGLGLGEFFGPKNIILLSPDEKKLQEIRESQIQFFAKKKLRFKKALQDTEKELSVKIDSFAKLKLLQKQLKQKNQEDLNNKIKKLKKEIQIIKKQKQPYLVKELESANLELNKLDF